MDRVAYFLREAWRGLWTHRSITLTSLLALFGSLLVPGVFLLVLINALTAVERLADRREMIVYLEEEIPDSTRRQVRSTLLASSREVAYVSKEKAWQELERELGDSELLDAVEENPLPESFRIKLLPEYLHLEAMDSIANVLAAHEGVEEVQFGSESVRFMDRLLATLRWMGLATGSVIALVVVLVVANTIRLGIVARREIHRVMSLVGAGALFIRVPLMVEGTLAAAMAATLALAANYGLFLFLQPRLPVLPMFLPWSWMAVFVAVSGVLGALGSLYALARSDRED